MTTAGRARRWPWWVLAAVALSSLAVGAVHAAPARTPTQRASTIEGALRCPSCQDVSVAQSSAPAAQAIRGIVVRRLSAGKSDAAIEAYLVSRYGQDILLRPPASGGIGLVWLMPVVALGAALAGLGTFFWRRRKLAVPEVSEADRVMVGEALAERAAASNVAPR